MLTDTALKKLKPRDTPYKRGDEKRLVCHHPTGRRLVVALQVSIARQGEAALAGYVPRIPL
jgi:hypothetical protein